MCCLSAAKAVQQPSGHPPQNPCTHVSVCVCVCRCTSFLTSSSVEGSFKKQQRRCVRRTDSASMGVRHVSACVQTSGRGKAVARQAAAQHTSRCMSLVFAICGLPTCACAFVSVCAGHFGTVTRAGQDRDITVTVTSTQTTVHRTEYTVVHTHTHTSLPGPRLQCVARPFLTTPALFTACFYCSHVRQCACHSCTQSDCSADLHAYVLYMRADEQSTTMLQMLWDSRCYQSWDASLIQDRYYV